MNSPNEAFADMVSKYTYGHIIPPDDFKGIIDLVKMEAIVYEDDLGKVEDEVAIPDD